MRAPGVLVPKRADCCWMETERGENVAVGPGFMLMTQRSKPLCCKQTQSILNGKTTRPRKSDRAGARGGPGRSSRSSDLIKTHKKQTRVWSKQTTGKACEVNAVKCTQPGGWRWGRGRLQSPWARLGRRQSRRSAPPVTTDPPRRCSTSARPSAWTRFASSKRGFKNLGYKGRALALRTPAGFVLWVSGMTEQETVSTCRVRTGSHFPATSSSTSLGL